MDDTTFWTLIERLGPDFCPGRLTIAYRSRPSSQALAFGWRLQRASAELDTPAHRRHARRARAHRLPDRDAVEPLPCLASGTPGFREVQLTVVALGRDTWAAVAAVPALMAVSWPVELGHHLAELAGPPLLRSDLARGA